jgi:DNA-binding transcriptional regulator GbsR (MarR family)
MGRSTKEREATEDRRRRAATEEERRFAGEVGSYWEDAGGTRMAGRVLGALLLADPPEMSSAELLGFLAISAGSVSTATRELIRPGLAERVRVPGDRQDYFRATMGGSALPQFIRSRLELTRRWERLMERGKELAEHKDPVVRRHLEEIRELYEFLGAEQQAILDRWEQRQRQTRRTGG